MVAATTPAPLNTGLFSFLKNRAGRASASSSRGSLLTGGARRLKLEDKQLLRVTAVDLVGSWKT